MDFVEIGKQADRSAEEHVHDNHNTEERPPAGEHQISTEKPAEEQIPVENPIVEEHQISTEKPAEEQVPAENPIVEEQQIIAEKPATEEYIPIEEQQISTEKPSTEEPQLSVENPIVEEAVSPTEEAKKKSEKKVTFSSSSAVYNNVSYLTNSISFARSDPDELPAKSAEELTPEDVWSIIKNVVLKPLCVGLLMGVGHLAVISVLKHKLKNS